MAKLSTRDEFILSQKRIEKMAGGKSLLADDLTKDEDYGFLANSLEFIDPELHRPFASYQAFMALPMIMAGGAKEYASFYKTNYSTSFVDPVASGSNNVIVTVKSQLMKTQTRVMPFSFILEVPFIDQLKADEIGYNIYEEFENGVMHQYNRLVDQIAFFGLPGVEDSYGLLNNPDVKTVAETTTAWDSQTASEFFGNLVDQCLEIVAECDYDENANPNTILMELGLFRKLSMPMAIVGTNNATATTGVSLYDYIMENLPTRLAGYDEYLRILPIKYLVKQGTNSTGRIVIYRYDKSIVRGVFGMELTRGATVFDATKQATLTSYVSFIGEPQFVKPSAIRYYDNKAN